MRKIYSPPKNPHSKNCSYCGDNLTNKWWIQIKNNVYCQKCSKKVEKLQIRKRENFMV